MEKSITKIIKFDAKIRNSLNLDCCDKTAKQIKKIQPIQNEALNSKFVIGNKQKDTTNAFTYHGLNLLWEILLNATKTRNDSPEYMLIEMTLDSEYNFGIGIKNETKKNLEYLFRKSDKVLTLRILSVK